MADSSSTTNAATPWIGVHTINYPRTSNDHLLRNLGGVGGVSLGVRNAHAVKIPAKGNGNNQGNGSAVSGGNRSQLGR